MPWLWVPNCLLFPHGFQLFCDWLKLGGIIACNLGNFSFSFIFYSIRRIKLRAWANFEVCWWFFFIFIYLLFGQNSNFCGSCRFVIGCKIGQNYRVSTGLLFVFIMNFLGFFLFLEYLRQ
jgi:hypothetical protein